MFAKALVILSAICGNVQSCNEKKAAKARACYCDPLLADARAKGQLVTVGGLDYIEVPGYKPATFRCTRPYSGRRDYWILKPDKVEFESDDADTDAMLEFIVPMLLF